MSVKGIGASNSSSYKETAMPAKPSAEEGSKKGYAVKSSDGTSQLGDKGGKAGGQSLDLSSRQIKQLLHTLFKSRGKEADAQFYKSIQTILPGADKKTINLFLVSHKLASKGDKDDSVVLKSLSNRQVKTNIKLTKMEMGVYDLKAASSAMAKYISQIEEKELGHKKHKKAVTDKVEKAKAKMQKERTGRAAPGSFHAAAKKRATTTTTAIASKDCLLTIDSYRMSGKSSKKKKKENNVNQQQSKKDEDRGNDK